MSSGVTSRPAGRSAARDRSTAAATRLTTWIAFAGIALTFVIFVALHLLPPTSQISPVHRTISEYALTSSAWAFDLGVVALALASVAAFAGAVLVGRIRVVSVSTVFGALWVAGLLTLVGFPKHNWALGAVSDTGQIHRMASLVAFLALPIAVITLAHAGTRGNRGAPTPARWAFWLGAISFLWFVPILVAVAVAPRTWWQEIPLGLVERGLALTEVLTLIAVTVLVRRSAGVIPTETQPTH